MLIATSIQIEPVRVVVNTNYMALVAQSVTWQQTVPQDSTAQKRVSNACRQMADEALSEYRAGQTEPFPSE